MVVDKSGGAQGCGYLFVTNKPKKNDSGYFAARKRKNETANPQNNTFASSDTRTDASACKRVVFFPPHVQINI